MLAKLGCAKRKGDDFNKRIYGLVIVIMSLVSSVCILSDATCSEAKGIRYRKEFKEKRFLVEDVVNQKIDKNKDGILSKKERNAVTSFTVGTETFERSDNVVIALDDLTCFPNLREVVISQRVSSLKPLYSLKKIESLSLPSGSVAYKKSIRFDKFPNLKKLMVSVKGITVNLKKNKKLQELDCASCDLEKLDLSNNRKLTKIICSTNNLKKLDLSNNPRLTKVICNTNKLTEILFHKEANIKYLDCSLNRIQKLTNLKADSLVDFNCMSNCLRTLELGQARNLEQAMIDSNEFVSVDVRNCTKLQSLSAQNNINVFKLYLPVQGVPRLFVDEMCQVEKG